MATDCSPSTRALVLSLRGTTCPACKGWKNSAQTLCGACYNRLPYAKRRALYKRVGEGYAEAVADAMAALGRTFPSEDAA